MIDFDQIETIPSSIISLLDKNRDLIRDELVLDTKRAIAGHQWEGGTVSKDNYNKVFQKITEQLSNKKIIGFHCTKLINPDEIITTGLKRLNSKEYELRMKKFLKEKIKDKKTIREIDKCFAEYNNNGNYKHRENMIWFVINKSLVHDSGCKYFFKYYGGEVIRRAAYSIKDVVFPILIQSGIPTVVAFEFDFKELADYHQDNLIKTLIESKVFEKSYKYYRDMEAEGYIERDINSQEIIQVFYDNDVKKLKNTVANKL